MPEKTMFGVIVSDRVAEVHERDIPSIGPNEIILENKSCNLCTTDYQQWMGLRPQQPMPMAFGHENSGIVVDVGSEVENVKVGDHVVLNNYKPCMECEECRQGRNSVHCRLRRSRKGRKPDPSGYYGNYGCAAYQIGTSKHALKVDKSLPFEHAGFSEPVATVVYGMKKLRVKPGEKLLVIGAGTMGNLNAQVAGYFGAEVSISDVSEKKLNTAQKLGFDSVLNAADKNYLEKAKDETNGSGFDAVIIAVGATQAYHDAFETVALEGRLLIFPAGYPPPAWNIDPNTVHYQQWEVIGTYGCGPSEFQTSVDLLSRGAIDVTPLVEERIPLKEIQHAFEKASTPDNYRVAVMI
jgi:L-iditol 2-dehydrogenase